MKINLSNFFGRETISAYMRISLQNPTQGPLITVSFADDAATVAHAFAVIGASRVAAAASDGLATLRTAAQFANAAPGAGGGAVSVAGPLALLGMLFAAGDAPQHKSTTEKNIQHSPGPAELRCLSNPYDTSVECAAVRSALALIPFSKSWESSLNAARASAAHAPTAELTSVDLPTDITLTAESTRPQQFATELLAHIEGSKDKRHAVSLTTEEEHALVALAQRVAAGESSEFDLGLLVWEILEGDLLRSLEAKGVVVDYIDTVDGPVYTIQWSSATNPERSWDELPLERRWLELQKVQNAYSRIFPRFKQLLAGRDKSTTLLPSSRYLLQVLPFLREKLRFVVGDLTADDFHDCHARGLSPAQVPLTRNIWLDDLRANAHGLSMLLHDIWHALLWEGQSLEVKAVALQLYSRIKVVMQGFPEHIKYLDRLIETIVQPPMEMGASSRQFINECRGIVCDMLNQNARFDHLAPQNRELVMQLRRQINTVFDELLHSTSN